MVRAGSRGFRGEGALNICSRQVIGMDFTHPRPQRILILRWRGLRRRCKKRVEDKVGGRILHKDRCFLRILRDCGSHTQHRSHRRGVQTGCEWAQRIQEAG